MGERLTIEEIRERYDGEWVLVIDPEKNERGEVLGGVVAAHSADRDKVYDRLMRMRPRRFASLCFKSLPEGWALAL